MVQARTTALLIAATLLFAAGRASAQAPSGDARERARLYHQTGLAEYQAGRYSAAVNNFRQAYKLVPAPGILFNLAQAYRLKGDCQRARRSYKKFLKVSNDANQTALAKEHLAKLVHCAGDAPPPPAPAAAPPTAAPAQPAAPPVTAQPPPTAAPAPAPPAPVVRETTPPPPTAAPTLAPPPAPAPAAATAAPLPDLTARGTVDSHPGRSKRLAGLGLGAAGAAFLVISVYHGLKARSDANELDRFYEDGGRWSPELADREDSLDRNRTRALGFGLVGAVALTGGGIFYWMGNQDEKRAAAGLNVAPGTGGAVVSWSGRF